MWIAACTPSNLALLSTWPAEWNFIQGTKFRSFKDTMQQLQREVIKTANSFFRCTYVFVKDTLSTIIKDPCLPVSFTSWLFVVFRKWRKAQYTKSMSTAGSSLCNDTGYGIIQKSYLHSRHFLAKVETEYTEISSVNASVPQVSILGQLLYLIYNADLPTSTESTTATIAENTAVLATDSDPAIASHKLQTNLPAIQN
jgi:hypothetical protein